MLYATPFRGRVAAVLFFLLGALVSTAAVAPAARAQTGQIDDFSIVLGVSDGESTLQSESLDGLTIGMRADATDGRDNGIDLVAPPPPPSGAFDARLIGIDGQNDYFTDFRAPTAETVEFEVAYEPGTGNDVITLTWDPGLVDAIGEAVIVDRFTGNVVVDMAATGELAVDASSGSSSLLQDGLIVRLRAAPADPIPVELAGFGVRADGDAAVLEWQTASETNNAGFAVEHRGPAARGWAEVGFVDGAGTTAEPQFYRFRTDGLKVGAHAFRLRQVDVDGTDEYSGVVRTRITLEQAYQLRAYPNPAVRATVELAVRETQSVQVAVYDLLGRQVSRLHDGPVPAQEATFLRIDADRLGLPNGMYFVRAVGETFRATERLLIVR
jgi:hypothetical protein